MVGIGMAACFVGTPARAQELRSEGAWLEFGMGAGWSPSDVAGDGPAGSAYSWGIGFTGGRATRLGVEALWYRSALPLESGAEAGSVTVIAVIYPGRVLTGPHMKLGVGAAYADVWDERVAGWDRPSGVAVTVGSGWGFRVGGDDALSLRLNWMLQWFGASDVRPSTNHVLALTMALTAP